MWPHLIRSTCIRVDKLCQMMSLLRLKVVIWNQKEDSISAQKWMVFVNLIGDEFGRKYVGRLHAHGNALWGLHVFVLTNCVK